MVEDVFLTDSRREVLDGDSNLNDQSLANEKYRIRKRARLALEELIEVAESDEISNESVIDSDGLVRLVAATLSGDGRITSRWNFDGSDAEYRDRYDFQMDACWKIQHTVDGYADTLLEERPPKNREMETVEEDPDLIEDT